MSRQTVVVKVGSSTVTDVSGGVDRPYLAELLGEIAALRELGHAVVLVSSGAIAAGVEALGLPGRPTDMPTLQATASIGQVRLIETYAVLAAMRGLPVGQVLLTRQDVGHRQQYLNACHTLERLLDLDVLPIVNENDTTAVDEIRFGDNDYLAALVGMMVHADLVVLMTDIEGLYESDPRRNPNARLVSRVEDLTDDIASAAGGPGSAAGSGGMATKLEAARVLMKAGIPLVVCHGRTPGILGAAVDGRDVGTRFDSGSHVPMRDRKLWLAYAGRPAGSVVIDDGASDALRLRGGSLLPAGVVDVTGSFVVGDPVTVVDTHGNVVARGLAGLSSTDLRRVRGLKSAELSSVLPDGARVEVVHRDHLVVL